MRLRKVFAALLGLLVLASPLALAWQRQNIVDWWRLRNYQPSSEIAALADHTTMNDLGRKLFYVHTPELKDKNSFGLACPNHYEESIVLGCYITHQDIYIYDVTDPRLAGIEEVTAAHEMLHAAYDRLSDKERQRIDSLTAEVFSTLTDSRIKETVESYRAHSPGVIPNELHSILGTEVSDLPQELEIYYSRYFSDRKKIVAYSQAYAAEFTSRQQAVQVYDQQLAELSIQISGLEQELRLQNEIIQSEQARLLSLRSSDPASYNQQLPAYNSMINAYNADVNRLRQLIDQYNDIVKKRNQIANEEQQLKDALNSNLPTL